MLTCTLTRALRLLMFLALAGAACLPLAAQSRVAAALWADSVLKTMTPDEKIGQLFMIAAYSNRDEADYAALERSIRAYHVGGLIFMQGNALQQVRLVNRYQQASRIPLLIGQDAEWGLSMRLDSAPGFPRNIALGAISDDSLLYRMGKVMARQLRRTGVQYNFAPVADVNNNARNPVINFRSFGENKFNVARKAWMLMRGMEDHGVMTAIKHFPGHGDTETDSHLDLPLIPHGIERLDTLELYPFYRLIQGGASSVMIGHLHVPALDPAPRQAASLSPRIVQEILRDSLRFDGLIVTDALNMKGVSREHPNGEAALLALLAGSDLLLMPEDLPAAFEAVRNALRQQRLTEDQLDAHLMRVLAAKRRLGLHRWSPIPEAGLVQDLYTVEYEILRKQLFESALTLARNEARLIPFQHLEARSIAYVQIGGGSGNAFERGLAMYAQVTPFYLRKDCSAAERDRLLEQIRSFNTVIVGLFDLNNRPAGNYGVTQAASQLCSALSAPGREVALTLFGNPYALQHLPAPQAVLLAYDPDPAAQAAAAAALFGGKPLTGRLPVTVSAELREGYGIMQPVPVRFGFALPEERGLDRHTLAGIDSIAQSYIARGAMPGCEVLVLRGTDIVYVRGIGRSDYGPQGLDIDPALHAYDLASVTKVAATTLCAMHYAEQGILSLDAPLEQYLPAFAGSNKAALTARQFLQHTSGLASGGIFHHRTYLDRQRHIPDPAIYQYRPDAQFRIPVGPSMYATDSVQRLVWNTIRDMQLYKPVMRYSDLGMMLLGRMMEAISGEPLDELCARLFYAPLGMSRTWFNPGEKGYAAHCPPTEADTLWRHAVLQGYVHDPSAAMLGGVAGHAGLFSNVYDLAKLMLMIKNGGFYGDRQYFSAQTIGYFTSRQLASSRRGLGWDKPEPGDPGAGPGSRYVSPAAYGHTGFTGTCVWVDPEADLVFIFLSNRTYPFPDSQRLLNEERV
ncbi:MAG: glycoside hydrolase family 3 N-terminal domain-containing protein, partial [Bacteroidia bacterium]|nr:glycoside hydrolase family 3 N-terminal domain-containing protein [Bacteroidia bacterium]